MCWWARYILWKITWIYIYICWCIYVDDVAADVMLQEGCAEYPMGVMAIHVHHTTVMPWLDKGLGNSSFICSFVRVRVPMPDHELSFSLFSFFFSFDLLEWGWTGPTDEAIDICRKIDWSEKKSSHSLVVHVTLDWFRSDCPINKFTFNIKT